MKRFDKFISKKILQENSLYTTPAERAALVADKEKVMNAIIFNFFGFLGLFKLSHKRGTVKRYPSMEKSLIPNSIGDDNLDVSLSIKLGIDAGIIKMSVANQMTRLLALLKKRRLTSADIDESILREYLNKMHLTSNRPSTMLYASVSAFKDGRIGIEMLAKDLHRFAKMKQFKPVSKEFRAMVTTGAFTDFFNKIGQQGKVTAPPTAAAKGTAMGATASKNPKAVKQTDPVKVATAASAMTEDNLFKSMVQSFSRNTTKDILKQAGVSQAKFPYQKFLRWIIANHETVGIVNSFQKLDIYRIIKNMTSFELGEAAGSYAVRLNTAFTSAAFLTANQYKNEPDKFVNVLQNFPLDVDRKITPATDLPSLRAQLVGLSDKAFELADRLGIQQLGRVLEQYIEIIAKLSNTGSMHVMAVTNKINLNTIFLSTPLFPGVVQRAYGGNIYDLHEQTQQMAEALGIPESSINNSRYSVIIKVTQKQIEKLETDQQRLIKEVIHAQKLFDGGKKFVIFNSDAGASSVLDTILGQIDPKMLGFFDITKGLRDAGVKLKDLTDDDIGKITEKIKGSASAQPIERILDLVAAQRPYGSSAVAEPLATFTFRIIKKLLNSGMSLNSGEYLRLIWMMSDVQHGLDEVYALLQKDIKKLTDLPEKLNEFINGFSFSSYRPRLDDQNEKKILQMVVDSGSFKFSIEAAIQVYRALGLKAIEKITIPESELRNLYSASYIDHTFRKYLIGKFPSLRDQAFKVFKDADESTSITEYLSRHRYGSSSTGVFSIKDIPENLVPDWLKDKIRRSIASKAEGLNDKNPLAIRKLWGTTNGIRIRKWEAPDLPNWAKEIYTEEALKISKTHPGGEDMISSLAFIIGPDELSKQILDNEQLEKLTTSGRLENDGDVLDNILTEIDEKDGLIDQAAMKKLTRIFDYQQEKNKRNFPKANRDPCMNRITNMMAKYYEAGQAEAMDEIYQGSTGEFRRQLVDFFGQYTVLDKVKKKLMDSPIKPIEELSTHRLPQVLSYNQVQLPQVKSIRSVKSLAALIKTTEAMSGMLKDMDAEQVQKSEEDMERTSVEFDVFNKYRHGNISVKFLKEFDVKVPAQAGFDEWRDAHTGTKIISPAFHGTGAVAASFILRYGFTVVKTNDSSVVGRMLGDGIYFSNVLDKVAQYIADSGYSRGQGNKGYILQMEAALGSRGQDYNAAGLGMDSIRSPEWCVFDPNNQLRIHKAYLVEIIHKSEMNELKKKFNINENTMVKIESFKDYLLEAQGGSEVTGFTFIDGNIPISRDKMVDFEDFDPSKYKGVTMEPTGLGPTVYIETPGLGSKTFAIRYTSEYMKQPELDDFISLLQPNA